MSERPRIRPGVAASAGSVDFGTGRVVLPGRVGAHFHGGPEGRPAGVGAGFGSWDRRGSGSSSRSAVRSGGNRHSPRWYRRVVLIASGASTLGVAGVAIVKAVLG